MDKLKPCPFCNGNAKLQVRQIKFLGQNCFGDKKIRMGAQVICNRCKARGTLYAGNIVNPYDRFSENKAYDWMKESAQKAWNRRIISN